MTVQMVYADAPTPALPGSGVEAGSSGVVAARSGDSNKLVYVLIDEGELDRLVLRNPRLDYVSAERTDDIERELRRRHPCSHSRCSFVSGLSSSPWGFYVNNSNDGVEGRFWEIEDRPIVQDLESRGEVQAISIQLGPVLVRSAEFYGLGSTSQWEADGFVFRGSGSRWCGRGTNYVRVNHNPKALLRRSGVKAAATNKKRLAGEFPRYAITAFVAAIHPRAWPYKHPFRDECCGEPLSSVNYGRTSTARLSEIAFCGYLGLTEKLWPGRRWWLKSGARLAERIDGQAVLEPHVVSALPSLHGYEWTTRKKGMFGSADRRNRERLALWIRQAAKAFKLKIPDPPIKPRAKKKPKPASAGSVCNALQKEAADAGAQVESPKAETAAV